MPVDLRNFGTPPEDHGNDSHIETFAVDGDAQPPENHGNAAHTETFVVDPMLRDLDANGYRLTNLSVLSFDGSYQTRDDLPTDADVGSVARITDATNPMDEIAIAVSEEVTQ